MLNELSQSEKDIYCMISLIQAPRIVRFIGRESRMVVTRGWGKGERGVIV